jgi:transposase
MTKTKAHCESEQQHEVVDGELFGPAPPQPGRRRRYTVEEKRRLVEEARSSSVSAIARKYGVSASQLFRWRRLADEGALEAIGADEAVVPESEVKQLRNQICELQRLLGKKTLENEILKEAIELTRSKKLLLRSRSHEPGGGE